MRSTLLAVLALTIAVLAGCLTENSHDVRVCETTKTDTLDGPVFTESCHIEHDPTCEHIDADGNRWTAPCRE